MAEGDSAGPAGWVEEGCLGTVGEGSGAGIPERGGPAGVVAVGDGHAGAGAVGDGDGEVAGGEVVVEMERVVEGEWGGGYGGGEGAGDGGAEGGGVGDYAVGED